MRLEVFVVGGFQELGLHTIDSDHFGFDAQNFTEDDQIVLQHPLLKHARPDLRRRADPHRSSANIPDVVAIKALVVVGTIDHFDPLPVVGEVADR